MDDRVIQAELASRKTHSLRTLLFSLTTPGRISRSEYWLRGFLTVGAAWALVSLCGLAERAATGWQMSGLELVGSLFLCWPGSVVIIKRMRDRDRSLSWLWIVLVPVIGVFYCIWLMFIDLGCFRGTRGPNCYGEDPLADRDSSGGWPVDRVAFRTTLAVIIGTILSVLTAMEIRDAFLNPKMMGMYDEIYKAFL